MYKLLASFVAVALVATVVGATWVRSARTPDCCYPGSPCCYPGSPCCVVGEDCCSVGAECCYPGSPCCGDACCTEK